MSRALDESDESSTRSDFGCEVRAARVDSSVMMCSVVTREVAMPGRAVDGEMVVEAIHEESCNAGAS